MENRTASNGGSRLPEAVIQNIQSLMSVKDAAQTSVLSKSWHLAWSTIPDLDLDQRLYGSNCDVATFLEYATKRIQRYEDSNLIINSFSLSMDHSLSISSELAVDLTLRALKLGAAELSLSTCLNSGNPTSPVTINAAEFRNLKSLRLDGLAVGSLFSEGSSSDFPCLKVLTLARCSSVNREQILHISSTSLESLTFECNRIWQVQLDVPSIRRFTFSGLISSGLISCLPSLTFKRASMDWDSDVSVSHTEKTIFFSSWILSLEAFLDRLSKSKVSLSLEMMSESKIVAFSYARAADLLKPAAVVDNLKMDIHLSYIKGGCDLFKCLFSSVEPKFITQRWGDLHRRRYSLYLDDDNYINLLCKDLMLEVSKENCLGIYTSSLPRLDHVIVEGFEEAFAQWQPLPLETLLDGSAALEDDHLIPAALEDDHLIRFSFHWI